MKDTIKKMNTDGIKEHLKTSTIDRKIGLTIPEIAEELSMFESDVEEVVKLLHSKDAVSCKWYGHKLYVIFIKEVNLEEPDIMFQ